MPNDSTYVANKVQQFLDSFPPKYRDGNLVFAAYAAFPTIFTPELLQLLWLNFNAYHKNEQVHQINYVAISDLLQSSLCQEVGTELYEMDEQVRKYLADHSNVLFQDRQLQLIFDKKALAAFTLLAAEKLFHHPNRKNIKDVLYWKAVTVLSPDYAGRKIAEVLEEIQYKEELSLADVQLLMQVNELQEELAEAGEVVTEFSRFPALSYTKGERVVFSQVVRDRGVLEMVQEKVLNEDEGGVEEDEIVEIEEGNNKEFIEYCLSLLDNSPNNIHVVVEVCSEAISDVKEAEDLLLEIFAIGDAYKQLKENETGGKVYHRMTDGRFRDLEDLVGDLKELLLTLEEFDDIGFSENVGNVEKIILNNVQEIVLDLSNKELTELPSNVKNYTQLKILNASHNSLKDVDIISKLTNLEHLDLSYNDIENLNFLKNLSKLKYLNLNNNNILDINVFELDTKKQLTSLFQQKYKNLQVLNLKNNKIKDVSFIQNFPSLKSLTLVGNPIENTTSMYFLPKLEHLELGDRDINITTLAIIKLKDICEISNRNNILSSQIKIENTTEIIEIAKSLREKKPLIQIYLNIFFLIKEMQIDLFQETKNYFFKYIYNIHRDEQKLISIYLLNYALNEIKKGRTEFNQYVFELYKLAIENGFLVNENDNISPIQFQNIINVACFLKEFDWARGFIKEHKKFLETSIQHEYVNIAYIIILFGEKKFNDIFSILNKTAFKHPSLHLTVKLYLLASSYELNIEKDLSVKCDSFIRFVRRQKRLGEASQKAAIKFGQILKKIELRKIPKKQLEEEIREAEHLYFRSWLKEKVKDYKPILEIEDIDYQTNNLMSNIRKEGYQKKYKYDVFLSYDRGNLESGEYVRQIIKELDKLNIKYWHDEKSIKLGEHIDYAIYDGIRESLLFIVFVANSSGLSQWVSTDYDFFQKTKNKEQKIILIRPDEQILSEFEIAPDFIINTTQKPFKEVAQNIKKLVTKELETNSSTSINRIKEPEMIFVQGGDFLMGSEDEDAGKDEQPIHQVTLDDFYIGKYQVTQQQWENILGNNPSKFKGNEIPVTQVSWDDIQVFIKKLNFLTGERYRLPTEAEWEYAARGGNQSKNFIYAGSNDLDEVAWYSRNSKGRPQPVGQKKANELGLYDMSGNVWEWCSDLYGKYENTSQNNPIGSSIGKTRVVRGGSCWYAYNEFFRVSVRDNLLPNERTPYMGFRLAKSE